MKMGSLERQFVNSPSHSRQVSGHAEKLLNKISFQAGQTYLDVGCGNGAAPIHIARKYQLKVIGVDVDPEQVRMALATSQGMDNVQFHTVDGTQLPFDDGTFDIVSTNKVMHHVSNWPLALAEMHRVLKPNGYLIYNDLVFPKIVASLGSRIIKKRLGFPTSEALDTFVKQNNLATIHLSRSPFLYEVICQKVQ